VTPAELIQELNLLLEKKHAEIIQYLLHAYSLGEGEIPSEIEEVSRESMRHFKWIAQFVVRFGGDPSMSRAPFLPPQKDRQAMLLADRDLARENLAAYQQLQAMSGNERLNQMLDRLIVDEVAHDHFFEKMSSEVLELVDLPMMDNPDISPEKKAIIQMLNEDAQDEYEALLKYLHQSFVTTDKVAADVLEDVAIEEMRHLGHLSEEVIELGGTPLIEVEELLLTQDLAEMLRSDISDEETATSNYAKHIDAIDDPGIKFMLDRIRKEEIHHTVQFKEVLDRISPQVNGEEPPAQSPEKPTLTVGSLYRQK